MASVQLAEALLLNEASVRITFFHIDFSLVFVTIKLTSALCLISVCFKVFDIDRDGVLNAQEIAEMINILLYVAKESSNSAQTKHLTYAKVFDELRERATASKMQSKITNQVVTDSNDVRDITFTQEDFMMWSVQSQTNLLQPFLDLLFEVCHVVLGLRPQCRHLEYNIGKFPWDFYP